VSTARVFFALEALQMVENSSGVGCSFFACCRNRGENVTLKFKELLTQTIESMSCQDNVLEENRR
jgi:hypothetical protein